MKALEPPDSLYLRAAEGWFGLGDLESAILELEKISPPAQSHPQVLEVKYCVYATAKKWDGCVEVGRLLVDLEPNQSFGWVNRSYAIRRASGGSVRAAYEALRPAAERQLDDLEQVTFNLACYACQLGNLDEAREWLEKAFTSAERSGTLRQRMREALDEDDLKPIRDEIKRKISGQP